MIKYMKKIFIPVLCIGMSLFVLCGCSRERIESQDELKSFAIAALNAGNYEDALSGFDEALSLADGRVSARELDICYYKAVTQYLLEDVTGACETLENVIAYDDKNSDAYYLRGSIYLSEGETELGIADMERSVATDGDDRERVIDVFNALSGSGQREAGLSIVSQALSELSDSREDILWRARYHLVLEQYDEALSDLDQIEGGDTERLLIQGEKLMQDEQYEAALGSFDEGLAFYDSDDDKGKKELSQETYRRLLSDRVAAYEFMGEWNDALKAAREYIALYPQDARMLREIKFLASR